MKIGMISDIHVRSDKRIPDYMEYVKKTIDFFIDECNYRGITEIIMLGDLFETKDVISTKPLVGASRYIMARFNRTFKRSYFIVGNHDTMTSDNETNIIEVFREYSNILVIDKPAVIPNMNIANNCWHVIPYMASGLKSMIDETIKWNKDNNIKKSILFGHFGVNGFSLNEYYKTFKEHLSTSDLKDFDMVFLGHFHSYQQIDNIVYVSSPFQQKHGDETGSHGFMFVDTDNPQNYEFISNPYTPQFVSVVLNKRSMPRLLQLKDHNIKISIQKKLDKSKLMALKEKLEAKNYVVKFTFDYLQNDYKVSEIKDWQNIVFKDGESIITEFIDTQDTEFDKKELKELLFK